MKKCDRRFHNDRPCTGTLWHKAVQRQNKRKNQRREIFSECGVETGLQDTKM